jgi:hypothetical protein
MSLIPNGPAPYTSVQALLTVIDWFRDKGSTGPVTAETVIRAGVRESLARRTIQSLVLLDLVDSDGKPSEQFEAFRSIRGEDEYRTALQEWVRRTYADVLTYCDPTADTYDKIVEAFRGYQPPGQRRSMATLLLGLWRRSGLPVADSPSPAGGSQAPRPTRTTRPTRPTRPRATPTKRLGSGRDRGDPDPGPSPAAGVIFGVTESDIGSLDDDEFQEVWAALGKVARARSRKASRGNEGSDSTLIVTS